MELKQCLSLKSTTEFIGNFGTGKTTFLKNFFEAHKEQYETVWFNANEFDYSAAPKTVFINEVIIELLKKSMKHELIVKSKRVISALQKIITNIPGELLKEYGIDISKTESEWTKAISNYRTEKEKIKELQNALNDFLSNSQKDFVLIIDDLDRSRPDFALEIIEISKHLFDVPNLSIVFVYDREAMDAIANKKYGERSGERYLTKYIESTCIHDAKDFFLDTGYKNYYMTQGLESVYGELTIRELSIFDKNFSVHGQFVALNNSFFGESNSSYHFLYGFLVAVKIREPNLLKFRETRKNKLSFIGKERLLSLLEKSISVFNGIYTKNIITNFLEGFKNMLNDEEADGAYEIKQMIKEIDNLELIKKPTK